MLVAYAIFALLLGLAILVTYGAWRKSEAIKNQQAAWPHLETLARLSAQIENDDKAPADAKNFVSFLADHAFSEEFHRKLLKHSSGKGLSQGILGDMKKEFGDHYGEMAHRATREFVYSAICTDFNLGRKLRHLKGTTSRPRELKAIRNSQSHFVFSQYHHHPHDHAVNGNHAVT